MIFFGPGEVMPRINHRMFIRCILYCSRCRGVKATLLSYSVITNGAQLLCYLPVFNVKNQTIYFCYASEQNPLNLKAVKNLLSKIGLFRVSLDPTKVYLYLLLFNSSFRFYLVLLTSEFGKCHSKHKTHANVKSVSSIKMTEHSN